MHLQKQRYHICGICRFLTKVIKQFGFRILENYITFIILYNVRMSNTIESTKVSLKFNRYD